MLNSPQNIDYMRNCRRKFNCINFTSKLFIKESYEYLYSSSFLICIKKTLMLLLLLTDFGCSNKIKNVDNKSSGFNIQSINEKIEEEKLCAKIKPYFIPLETNDNCLIGKVNKVIYENDRLLIFDKTTQAILEFDKKGNFKDK